MHIVVSFKRFVALALFIASATFLAGCYSTGIYYDSDGVKSLQPQVSTFEDAVLVMDGPPVTVYPRPDGSKWALWRHGRSLLPDAIYYDNSVMLEFDAQDVFVRKVPYAQ